MTWRPEDPQGNEALKMRFDLVPYFGNSNLDIGCGPNKVWPHFVGIDNGKDVELFGIQMRPDVVVGTAERLPMFATGAIDLVFSSHTLEHIVDFRGALAEWWRLVKVGGYLALYLPHADHYPKIGQPGANPDHKHDFLPEHIVEAMRAIAVESGTTWDLVENQTRTEGMEYSFFQVYRKEPLALEGEGDSAHYVEPRESWRLPKPEKRAAIVRPGAYGDAIWAGALARSLKRDGYDVTLYTGPIGREVMRADPHVDRIITMPNGMLDDNELLLYFLWESRKYTRFCNLIGVVEGRLLPHPNEIAYYWPERVRRARMNANYLERIFEAAEQPLADPVQRFYPDAEETAWALEQKRTNFPDGKVIAVCPTGSGAPKTWPHLQRFLELMHAAGVYTIVLGEIRQDITAPGGSCALIGNAWPIRRAMALAQVCDLVVGEETGILNAVASCAMPKVVLLSHSSAENLTKHWRNTIALSAPAAVPCHPCHRLHRGFEFCTRDTNTKWAACQAALGPDYVAGIVFRALGKRLEEAA